MRVCGQEGEKGWGRKREEQDEGVGGLTSLIATCSLLYKFLPVERAIVMVIQVTQRQRKLHSTGQMDREEEITVSDYQWAIIMNYIGSSRTYMYAAESCSH